MVSQIGIVDDSVHRFLAFELEEDSVSTLPADLTSFEITGPTGEVDESRTFTYSLSINLSFGQQLGKLTMQAFENGKLIYEDSHRRNRFSDRTWLDQGEGIGKNPVDADDVLGIKVANFEAMDAIINIDHITSDHEAEILVKAFNDDTLVHSEVFTLDSVPLKEIQNLNLNSQGLFNTLYISAADEDTIFTFHSVELPTAFRTGGDATHTIADFDGVARAGNFSLGQLTVTQNIGERVNNVSYSFSSFGELFGHNNGFQPHIITNSNLMLVG
ncbi:MAG: hypothetical protein KME23_18930 [Goleter apudmare HA4340-LM2]|jgi:hypothetical protein|nr:hypothetical protein [Goleter apudmare HA4340-LM2]